MEVAETLEEKGVDAVSLNGGYIAWLIDTMKQKEAEDAKEEVNFAKEVEQSLRKKFKKTSGANLPRRSMSMSW